MKNLVLGHWKLVVGWVILLSLIAFVLMGVDKERARRRAWRVPERTFFLLALLGGCPGAIAGMWLFRHKTRHWSFKLGLPLILLLQAIGLGLILR